MSVQIKQAKPSFSSKFCAATLSHWGAEAVDSSALGAESSALA